MSSGDEPKPGLCTCHTRRCVDFSGQRKDGIAALHISLRLDPQDPMLPSRLNLMALGLYLSGEYEAAVEIAKRVTRSSPDYPLAYRWLAAALG